MHQHGYSPDRSVRRVALSLALSLVVALTAIRAPAQDAGAMSLGDLSTRAWRLAEDGKLAELWDQIGAIADEQPELASLREASEKAMADLDEHIDDGEMTKALTSAVEAHGLSEKPDEFLKSFRIQSLVDRAKAEAKAAENKGNWFESLILYRRLDLLYDDHNTYRDDLQRVSGDLRLLRLYAPDLYYKQADDYARSQGEEPGEHWAGDEEQGWQQELAGIDEQMLLQALTRASDRNVENIRLDKLFVGGIDALRAMIDNQAIADTFPGLADANRVRSFDRRLAALREKVDGRFSLMGYGDTASRFNQLLEDNRETVKLPERVLIHEFADGAMGTLDDFSAIIWPSEMQQFERTTKQEFSGVGIQITLTDEELTVVSPLEGTPAHRAGLKAGDRIVTIDGKSTVGISLNQAVRAITGPEDTTVTLGIQSPGKAKARDVTLTRSKIKIHSVKGFGRQPGGLWDFWVDPVGRIGYVRLTQFGPDTVGELDAAIAQMRYDAAATLMAEAGVDAADIVKIVSSGDINAGHQGVGARLGRDRRAQVEQMLRRPRPINGLVVDLRFNPGGLLKSAVDVSNRFIDSGVIVSGHAGAAADEWTANADAKDTYEHFPLVVLINKGSASASEIVSGCVQDHDRGLVLGENSYGKGSVQQLFPLKFNQAFVKITTQYYKLPSGRVIHRRPDAIAWGVKPDVEVRMTDMQVEQLIKARMANDVLRDDDEDVDPQSVIGQDDEEDAESANGPLPTTAHEILERGYDPQLEIGILLLKARLIGDLAAG